jgi:hypothetical protein
MLYLDADNSIGTIYAYYGSKPWLEGEATHNRWEAHIANYHEWGKSGADSLEADCSYNEADEDKCDRGSGSQGSVSVDYGWNYLSVDTGKINDWLRGDSTNSDTADIARYVIYDNGGSTLQSFFSSEYATA